MVTNRQPRREPSQSTDDDEYRRAFYEGALSLIIAGYRRFICRNAPSEMDEPGITGEIVKYAREYINDSDSPDWTQPYVIYDEGMENTKGRKGKERKKVDIVCVLTTRRPALQIKCEAKRLRRPGFSVGKYVGREGLGEFVSGNYAPELTVVSMLGYVQSDSCDYWAGKISAALKRNPGQTHLQNRGGHWQGGGFDGVGHCYVTEHNRPQSGRGLLIYHLLLDFVASKV